MSDDLVRLVSGFHATQAIHAAVELGVPDLLGDGERTSDDLAKATGADPSTLYRLLRALASLGVLHEAEGRRFSLTPARSAAARRRARLAARLDEARRPRVRLALLGQPHRRGS